MCNQNIISNKFDLNLTTTLSSYYTVIIIITYDRKTFIVQATGLN
jgi:hypothetical protein